MSGYRLGDGGAGRRAAHPDHPVDGWGTGPDGSPDRVLRECLSAAIAAPSVHNTQPWRFRPRGGGVDVFADYTRRLDVIDPDGRELMISVGAAILNLRVAILAHGREPLLRPFPSPGEPDLVAHVTPGPPQRPDATVRALADAVPRRRTNRRPFSSAPVPDEVLGELAAAARAEGAELTVADRSAREAVISLVRTADARRREDPAYWAELAEWTLALPGRRDGVPPETFGPWSALEALPLRDFGLIQPARNRRVAHFEDEPTLAVLRTPGDGTTEWLRAGQALERVLLTATVRGVASTLMTQPVEIPELRSLLDDPMAGRRAQAVIRLGYGPPTAPTPRRSLRDVLVTPHADMVW
ncbi:MAG TPA: nitroreductase family protein [Micromonosporaceae bacterium]